MIRTRKYYALMGISAILLMGTLVNSQEAYAAKPTSIKVEITVGPGGIMNVEKDAGKQYNLDPNDLPTPPSDDVVTVVNGDIVEVLPVTGKTTLEGDTCFFIGATQIIFNNKAGSACLHTSCSQPVIAGVTFGQFPAFPDANPTHKITVTEINGPDLGEGCLEVVGGSGFVIDKTALLVGGIESNSYWLIPVLVSAIGIGIVIARKF